MIKAFIDGKEGTTGLKIYSRLSNRKDIKLITLPEEERKDILARKKCINESDVTFLCLPDAAAIEAVSLVENDKVKIIDASTAHRTLPDWAYGFKELGEEFEKKIKTFNRIAVPGCHASGFLSIAYPLVKTGLLKNDYPFVCYSLTGYSGGGKKMIAEYETAKTEPLFSPRQYGITQQHKHLKEMQNIAGLKVAPFFAPIVDDYYSGMEVSVPIVNTSLSVLEVYEMFKEFYKGQTLVKVASLGGEKEGLDKFIPANYKSGKDDMLISVGGRDGAVLVTSTFDNLGKGASGAAVQCMNIAFNFPETEGLDL